MKVQGEPTQRRRVAVMDVGTNSVRLLITEVKEDQTGPLRPLVHTVDIARIGEGVQATGQLKPEAMHRAVAALEKNLSIIGRHGAELLGVVATSAVRDAENRMGFVDLAARVGIKVEVISGDEEARLSYLGAVKGLALPAGLPVAVVDIGGGSTEVVTGKPEYAAVGSFPLAKRFSAKVGAVRMTEKHLGELVEGSVDLESPSWYALREDVARALDELVMKVDPLVGRQLIAVGGTATTLAAMEQSLIQYDYDRVHGFQLSREAIQTHLFRLTGCDLNARKEIAGLQPERADIIMAGVEILRQIAERAAVKELVVSDSDLLQGMIYDRVTRL